MTRDRSTHVQSKRALATAGALIVFCALPQPAAAQLPLEPMRDSGQAVTAAYEGWFRNSDGTISLLVGYFNRNAKQTLDIPAGPNNRIEPGGPDRGQPTHFLPRRNWGVFQITVPGDFGDKELTWTIVANNQITEIPMRLDPLWEVSPFQEATTGNTPPAIRFEQGGATFQGPPSGIAHEYTARVSVPLTLTVWATDDNIVDSNRRALEGLPFRLFWSKYRGPGDVSFSEARPSGSEDTAEATTTASFSAPGEYLLRIQGTDVTRNGGGGSQCCWTNAHVKVTVEQ